MDAFCIRDKLVNLFLYVQKWPGLLLVSFCFADGLPACLLQGSALLAGSYCSCYQAQQRDGMDHHSHDEPGYFQYFPADILRSTGIEIIIQSGGTNPSSPTKKPVPIETGFSIFDPSAIIIQSPPAYPGDYIFTS